MAKPMKLIHNIETGEIIEREMNAAELKQWELDKVQTLVTEQAEADKALQKAVLLAKLGITEDEAKLLLA